jgi:hypothetical protein
MKKLIFLGILLLIAASYCYTHRDMFRDKDTLSFGTTPSDVQRKTKVAAFINEPKKVEYKGGQWYGDGKPAIIVYDGQHNYGLAKEYKHVQLFITVDERFYLSEFSYDKADEKDAYDHVLNITPKDSSYIISGGTFHLGKQFITFNGNHMYQLWEGLEILYNDAGDISKTH